jgi:hypothetical protein
MPHFKAIKCDFLWVFSFKKIFQAPKFIKIAILKSTYMLESYLNVWYFFVVTVAILIQIIIPKKKYI